MRTDKQGRRFRLRGRTEEGRKISQVFWFFSIDLLALVVALNKRTSQNEPHNSFKHIHPCEYIHGEVKLHLLHSCSSIVCVE